MTYKCIFCNEDHEKSELSPFFICAKCHTPEKLENLLAHVMFSHTRDIQNLQEKVAKLEGGPIPEIVVHSEG